MKKFYKIMFFSTLMFGTLITISSYTWFGMWIGLEINLLSFIPLISNTKNSMTAEASMKYFITQALASAILLFSMILISLEFNINTMMIIFNTSLLTKMGTAPFHFWFPEVMEGLNWLNCLILLTWQKAAPMIMIMYNFITNYFYIIIMISMIISGIMGLNQISLRKILAFSSINHMGWMFSAMMFSETIWLIYFLIYSIMTIFIILFFYKFNIFYMKQLFNVSNNKIMIKLFFMINFLSLGGLPPFIGFFPKWLVIQNLINNQMFLLSTLMVTFTLMTLYFYMRLIFSSILLTSQILNINQFKMNSNFIFYCSNFINISSLILITLTFNFF